MGEKLLCPCLNFSGALQGGVRVPAFAHWPGQIKPGLTAEVAATYDIFPTVLQLAGGQLPTDRIIDGKDISGILFGNGTSPHECIFIYKGTPGALCPSSLPNCPGLWAVRCGPYKLQYV